MRGPGPLGPPGTAGASGFLSRAFPLTYIPEALTLGDKPKFVSTTDGDTPTAQLCARILGIDAPDLHYDGATETTPDKHDAALESLFSKAGKSLDTGLKAASEAQTESQIPGPSHRGRSRVLLH